MKGSGFVLTILFLSAVILGAAEQEAIELGTARAVPGAKVRGSLKAVETADGSDVLLPISIVNGQSRGPVVWIQACAHGDEFGGARALQEMVRDLVPEKMSGAVVAVLISNPLAFRGMDRVNPDKDDRLDLTSTFPGNPNGFSTERVGAAIFPAVREKATYFIDLHTGGDRFRQHPFVLYSVTGSIPKEKMDRLARGFGLKTLWRDTVKVFPNDPTTLLVREGIPAFLLEVGGGQPVDPAEVRLMADSIRNFLRSVGVLPEKPLNLSSQTIVEGYRIITNSRGGFFDAAVKPGDRIKEGSVLGTIIDAYGDIVEKLVAPAGSDIVLGVLTYPVAPTGAWLIEVGSIKQE